MPSPPTPAGYDGTAPFPDSGQPPATAGGRLRTALQPGGRRTEQAAVAGRRLSPLPASSGRLR